jgi:uncharacterized membrane protein YedE/YeeE
MTLAGGCVNKNLIRLGGGSVRSLVVLAFMAIAAYMTLKGLFGQWRATWLDQGFASLDDLRNQLIGAVLMGSGGVTAMGCTVSQGMSGLSTLAIGSLIAVAGIVGGAVATMKFMLWRED